MKITIDFDSELELQLAVDKLLDHIPDFFDEKNDLEAAYEISGFRQYKPFRVDVTIVSVEGGFSILSQSAGIDETSN